MENTNLFIDAALSAWKTNVDRAGKFFLGLSDEQLQKEIAPGKNRVVYLLGHLTAISDMFLPMLRLGTRLHPELDTIFISNPDNAQTITLSVAELKGLWTEVHDALWQQMDKLSPEEWLERHGAVSEEDFAREPHRNRYAVLLSRTSHMAYHFGQAILTRTK